MEQGTWRRDALVAVALIAVGAAVVVGLVLGVGAVGPGTLESGRTEQGGTSPVAGAVPAVTAGPAAAADPLVGTWRDQHPARLGLQARQYGVHVSLGANGRLQAVDGCLAYTARWRRDGRDLVTWNWRAPQRDCLGQGPVARQPLVRALAGRTRLAISSGQHRYLVLRRVGEPRRQLVLVGPPGTMLVLPGIFWTTAQTPGSPFFDLDDDGTFAVDTGCGLRFAGTWEQDSTTSALVHVSTASGRCAGAEGRAVDTLLPLPVGDLADSTLRGSFGMRQSRFGLSLP